MRWRFHNTIYHAPDALYQNRNIEVDEQAKWSLHLNRLHLDNYGVIHQDIKTISTIEYQALVDERHQLFRDDLQLSLAQFVD